MAKARIWLVRGLGLLSGLVLALAAVSCWNDDSGDDVGQASICQLRAAAGDGDCDGIANRYDQARGRNDFRVDSDGDRVVDAFDRFWGAHDFGDRDRDGWANWADLSPTNSAMTRGTPRSDSPAHVEQAERRALVREVAQILVTETKRLRNENLKLEFLNRQLDRPLSDRDMDRISDIYDAQPDLHFSENVDRGGAVNGQDNFPYDPTNE